MKLKSTHFLCLALGLAAARAQEIKVNLPGKTETPAPAAAAPAPSAAPAAAPAAPTFTDAQLLEEFGWFIGKRVGLSELGFSKAELDQLVKGLQAASDGKDTPYELQKIGPAMDEFMQKKQSVYVEKMKKQSVAQATAFAAKLKENKNVVELPSGLRYEIVKPGEGAFPKPTDTVKVHYTGTLVDGSVFDTSLKPREPGAPVEPAEFPLDQVIPGWTEGIQKINKGGKIKLYVPANLAYGDDGRPGIPPGSMLLFDVELLDFKATPPPPPADAMPAPAAK